MKKLKLPDSFAFARIIESSGCKDDICNFIDSIDFENNLEVDDTFAFKFFIRTFIALAKEDTEKLVYEFLAGVFEMTTDEVRDLDFEELGNQFKELVRVNNIKNFLKGAQELMK